MPCPCTELKLDGKTEATPVRPYLELSAPVNQPRTLLLLLDKDLAGHRQVVDMNILNNERKNVLYPQKTMSEHTVGPSYRRFPG